MSLFERYLSLWVTPCILVGLVLGNLFPGVFNTLAGLEYASVTIEKIEDMRQIVSFGVMTTPAVVVGEKVVHKGSVPSHDQVLAWLS
jgi:Thioredoxin domain